MREMQRALTNCREAVQWLMSCSASATAAVLVGILLRLGVVFVSPNAIIGADADAYMFVGGFIRDHGELPLERGLPAVLPPAYPLLIAAIGWISGAVDIGAPENLMLLKAANILAAGIAIMLVGRFGKLVGGRTVGLMAAWIQALYPPFLLYASHVQTESLFHPLLLGSFIALDRLLTKPTLRTAVGYGALLGFAALLRPAAIVPGAVAVIAGLIFARGMPWRTRFSSCIVSGLACIVLVLPWSIYASQHFHARILLADAGGFNFWDGHHPLNYQIAQLDSQEARDRLAAVKDAERRAIVADCAERGCTRDERERWFYSNAWIRMNDNGASLLWHSWANFVNTWKTWADPIAYGWAVTAMSALFVTPLTVFGLFGLWIGIGRPRKRPIAIATLASLASFTLLAASFVGTFRYRFGHIDPLLIAYCGLVARPLALRGRSWIRARFPPLSRRTDM